ncbi:MAG: hypothetical protein ACI9TH_002787 [Kiritimatiellia bacterium]|jgi:hypothetical protein
MARSKKSKQAAPQVTTALSAAHRGITREDLNARVEANKKRMKAKAKAKKKMEKDKAFSPLQGIAGLAMILALGWWSLDQLKVDSGLISFNEYHTGRIVLLASAYVLVLISAFQASGITGMMCVLFPPYMVYFMFVPMESSALKGMVVGLGIFIFMEHKQLSKQSVYTLADQTMSKFTGGGRNALNNVSGGHY